MNVIKDKNFKKLYLQSKIETNSVEYSEDIQKYLRKNKQYLSTLCKSRVFQDNRTNFNQIFGKKLFSIKNILEFNYDCWMVEFEGLPFLILSGAGKGTCYERVLTNEDNTHDYIKNYTPVKFFDEIINRLNKVT